jgi:two-component system, chemotaxis family, response regulator Rcp1
MILLVEDSQADAILIQEALRQAGVDQAVETVTDGEQALARLRGNEERPDLVLLDLNLPRKDGRAVLAEVKADADLQTIPVIILTTSSAPADIAYAYRHHANSYVRKPIGLEPLIEAAVAIRDYWFQTATPPAPA